MEILYIVGLVFLCIFFILVAVLAGKSWRVFHVICLIFVFAISIAYSVLLAMSAKTHLTFKKQHQDLTRQLENAHAETIRLTTGGRNELEFTPSSLRGVEHLLGQSIYGRQRVWRDCVPQLQADSGEYIVTVQTPADDDAGDGGDPVSSPVQIVQESPLYVFLEGPSDEGDWNIPVAYLGEFVVTAVTDNSVTLQPNLVFQEALDGAIGAGATWVLYEAMPIDDHDVFRDQDRPQVASRLPLPSDGLPLLDPSLDPTSPEFDQQKYDALVAQYQRELELTVDHYQFDGKTLQEISQLVDSQTDRINPAFDPPPEEVAVEVKFVQRYTHQVDQDAAAAAGSTLDQAEFDPLGRAISENLQHGSEVTFEVGETILVDQATGETGYQDVNDQLVQSLIDQGICEIVNRRFVRRLNDYQFYFQEVDQQTRLLDEEIVAMQRNIVRTNKAFDDATTQERHRDQQITLMTQDIERFENDLQIASEFRKRLEAVLSDRKQEINQYYQAIKQLAAEKAHLQAQLSAYIQQRTKEVKDTLSE